VRHEARIFFMKLSGAVPRCGFTTNKRRSMYHAKHAEPGASRTAGISS
jgi:glutaredoxin-related protein